MLILGIDTATMQSGCAIGGHEGVLASTQCSRGRRHAENLAPAIEFVCEQSGIELKNIGVIAVDVGPGLFTGLRVGMATGRALAHGLGIPMIGVPSLDLLAFAARLTPRLIGAVVDARRGEVYFSTYRQVPGGIQRIDEYSVGSPEEVASRFQAMRDEVLLVGDGARRYSELFAENPKIELADPSLDYPSAISLVQLAHAQAMREEFLPLGEVEPMYLRRPDAEINWAVRDRSAS
ncbi:MAG TPA: tRNA (adenosine(37)-N6)-threonylcarbamoyltransferase complex dimerization subunit type 1 TsaB [Acidimicrobiaceae bacterium]|nr:tRNA (adenosine(37)-N6)-threonylcarbamoyltransferase complex dimerization subunit type 1 TsaB [Acidimicrobiaceae bacterium]